MQDMILVLDFSRQHAAAAAQRLRAENICSRILPGSSALDTLMALDPMGIILAGGTQGALLTELDGRLLRAGIPVLALGDAAASAAILLSGEAGEAACADSVREVRFAPSRITQGLETSDRLLCAFRPLRLSGDLMPLAETEGSVIGFMHGSLPIFGLGFQIEPNDPDGTALLLHFAREVCGCSPWWNDNAFVAAAKAEIAAAAEDGMAICLMDGGLKSGVAAMLAHQAVGERLRCVFVDSGLLRSGEAEDILEHYRDKLGMSVIRISADSRFLTALAGKVSQEEKREAIAGTMGRVLEETLSAMDFRVLIRASNYEELQGEKVKYSFSCPQPVLEPLRELFRDEIRGISETLGLPPEITSAQPFPSTGLALRIAGEVTGERLELLRKSDALFREEVARAGLGRKLYKYFAYLYPLPSAADGGAAAIGLRALNAPGHSGSDRTTPSRLPYDLLESYVSRVCDLCPQIRKVFYDLSPGRGLAEDERL